MNSEMSNAPAKAGTLLLVDQGAYSNYTVIGFFVALREFTPADELREFLAANPDQAKDFAFKADRFLQGLINKGLLLEVQYGNLHLGDYTRADGVDFTPVYEGGE